MKKNHLLNTAVGLFAIGYLLCPTESSAQANYAIKFTTVRKPNIEEPKASIVRAYVATPSNASAPIWIDLNNDGTMQENERVKVYNGFEDYPIGSSDMVIYGPVEEIYLFSNEITKIDPSGNPALKDLRIANNSIEELDISKNEKMIALRIQNNQRLKTLTLNKNLIDLFCYSNMLKQLDVSECLALHTLSCYDNQINELIIPDPSKNSAITRIGCFENKIKDAAMTTFLRSLPARTDPNAQVILVNPTAEGEQNQALRVDVEYATANGWAIKNKGGTLYEGVFGESTVAIGKTGITAHSDGQNIFINGAKRGILVELYNAIGAKLYSGRLSNERDVLPINLSQGIYLLQIDGQTVKIIL